MKIEPIDLFCVATPQGKPFHFALLGFRSIREKGLLTALRISRKRKR